MGGETTDDSGDDFTDDLGASTDDLGASTDDLGASTDDFRDGFETEGISGEMWGDEGRFVGDVGDLWGDLWATVGDVGDLWGDLWATVAIRGGFKPELFTFSRPHEFNFSLYSLSLLDTDNSLIFTSMLYTSDRTWDGASFQNIPDFLWISSLSTGILVHIKAGCFLPGKMLDSPQN